MEVVPLYSVVVPPCSSLTIVGLVHVLWSRQTKEKSMDNHRDFIELEEEDGEAGFRVLKASPSNKKITIIKFGYCINLAMMLFVL